MDYQTAALALAVVVAGILVVRLARVGSRESFLPPGPKTMPILGNLHQLPLKYAHIQFTKWAREFGGIYSLKASDKTIVVITDPVVAKEMMDRRSATTSDRPPLHVANELITNGHHVLVLPYGPRWRLVRKIMHQYLTIKMCEEKHGLVQSAESTQMIHDLIVDPSDFYKRTQRYSTAVILSIVFGRRGPTFEGAVKDIYDVMGPWSEIVETGATPPVDIFPFLKYLPNFLSPWRAKALHVRALELKLYGGLADEVRARRAKGIDRGSLLDKVLEMQAVGDEPLLSDEQVAYIGGVLLEGGSDTTSSLTLSFILASAAFPDMLAKVQAEVDSVCGRGRMPTWADYDDLPYVRMCVKEVQRWRPVVIQGFPHYTTRDEVYKQYLIPKGTTLITNSWGMSHDPQRYPDSNKFEPERYRDFPLSAPEYAALSGDDVRDHYGYGWGRRICVGLHVAERSMFLNIARLAWAFDIKQDPQNPVDIDSYSPGFLAAPNPFKCQITPRDAGVTKVVSGELEEAKSVFKLYED